MRRERSTAPLRLELPGEYMTRTRNIRFIHLQRRACAAVALLTLSLAAVAAETVKAANAWVRAPVAGMKAAAAYLELTSDRNMAVVAAGSPAAGRVEMHSSTTEGGVMRMRPLSRIDLPAGQTVKLAPGGTHLMLLDLKQTLRPGDKLPLVLSLQPADGSGTSLTTVTLEAEIRAANAPAHNH